MSAKQQKKPPSRKANPNNGNYGFLNVAEETKPAKQIEATREKEGESNRTNLVEWHVKFRSSENLYPQNLAWAYRNSPTHRAIVNATIAMCMGGGFVYHNLSGEEIDSIPENESRLYDSPSGEPMFNMRAFYKESLMQWKLQGELWYRCKRARSGDKTSWTVSVVDGTKPRISKDGKNAVISPYWDDIRLTNGKSVFRATQEPDVIPIWDMDGDPPYDEFMIFMRRREPGYDRYGLPDYLACLKACFIEYMTDSFNMSRLENGYFPDIFVTLIGDPPEGMDAQQWMKDEYNKMKGGLNAGKPRINAVSDKDNAPVITELDGNKDGQFLAAKKDAFDSIVRAHRFFPKLAGIETAGQLGGNQELINMWKIVTEMVAIPDIQEPVMGAVNFLIKMMGGSFQLSVDNASPVGMDDKIDPMQILTVNRLRKELGEPPLPEDYTMEVRGEEKQVGEMLLLEVKAILGIKELQILANVDS